MVGQKGNEDLFRYILKASKEMGDEEKRFQFVRSQINSLEDCMEEGPNKHATIKSLANWAVKEFTAMEKFKNDKRMLDIWKIMGKYSENMGMDGVLENLHRIGFFKDCPEFYLMWAEHWAIKGKLENFNKTMQICKENCPLSPYDAKELFKPLLIKYFDMEMENSNSMDGKTMDLIKMLADKPEDVRPELTLFPYERTIAPDPKHRHVKKSQMLEGFEHQRQQRESMPPATTTANREEFSVFKDPTSVIHHQPTQTQFLKQNMQQEEPLQKNIKQKGMETQPKKTAPEELQPLEPMNNPSTTKINVDKNQSNKMVSENYGRRQSFIPDLNDVTVAGSHGKFSSAMLTSTPRRSINPVNFDPVYALSPQKNAEQLFFDDLEESINKEGGGLFGGVGTSNNKEPMVGGSSKLQKRLSLLVSETPQQQIRMEQPQNPVAETQQQQTKRASRPSDIIKTMPKLKIGSTIEEVSEEKENTTNTNSIFSSPFRKKTKLGGGDDPSKSQPVGPEKQLVDKDESTHTGMIVEKIKIGTINPWDEQLRREFLARSPAMAECYQLPSNKCPRLDLNRTINLGGEQFLVNKLLGEGGFARVYKAKSLNNKQYYAIKYESPPCPWEVYICAVLRCRFQPKYLNFVMQIREAYIFSNASAIVYDYYPHGSLLDLSNVYKKNGAGEMSGLLATYFGIQLGRILEQVYAANIIHGDVKPDNIMLTIANLDERKSMDQLLSVGAPAALKLIDWGRSIDMEKFPAGQEFIGRAGTENFDCYEMTCGMPWTYQTDFYGFVASIYVLLRGEYLQTFKFADEGRIIPKTPLKRRMALYDLWQSILGKFLNIPNCKELPKWAEMNRQMEEGLKTAVETELGLEWKKAVERFNAFMKQQMSG